MRSEWAPADIFGHVLAALMPANRLAIEVSARYGLRISDVLSLKKSDVERGRFTIRESKTAKTRRITLGKDIQLRLIHQSGKIYIFEHRLSPLKHRTRQAVYKDIVRAAKAYRVKPHLSPHSARKMYAVDALHRFGGDLERVQHILNHSGEALTMIYALADMIYEKKYGGEKIERNV